MEDAKEGKRASFLKSAVVGMGLMECLWVLDAEEIDLPLL